MVRRTILPILLMVYSYGAVGQDVVSLTGTQRVWIFSTSERTTRLASLHTSFRSEQPLPGVITFDCQVTAPEPLDEVLLALTINDPAGKSIFTGNIRLDLSKGTAPAKFLWQPGTLPDGDYGVHFDLRRKAGGELAETWLTAILLSESNIQSMLDGVKARTVALRQSLDSLRAKSVRPAYAAVHTAILEDYLPIVASALAGGDWPRAHQFASYLDDLAKTARLELSVVTPRTASEQPLHTRPAGKATLANGSIMADSAPIYLFGASYQPDIAGQLSLLERYGLHLAVFRETPADTLADSQSMTGFVESISASLEDARRSGIHVVVDLAPNTLPEWTHAPNQGTDDSSSFAFNVLDSDARMVLARHIGATASGAAAHSNVLAVMLAGNPALHLPDAAIREGLIAFAQSRYGEYDNMNRHWRTRYLSFDEIGVDWNSRHPAYLYDLQSYHQESGTQFFAWLANLSRKAAPGLPAFVQFDDTAFEKGESAKGIDREAVLTSMDMSGVSAVQIFHATGLALDDEPQTASYALLRSLRPSLPVVNVSDRFIMPSTIIGRAAYGRVYSMMWEGVLAGLDASAIDLGEAGKGNRGVLSRPEFIDAYATANLDINRLAPIIASLQEAPAPVRILWSMSSKIFDNGDPYVASALRAYEGSSSFGPRTLFVSERDCGRNGLDGVSVLVIPKVLALSKDAFRAIDRYIESGGVTIRQGNPFPYDQQGISRTETVSVSKRTILLRNEDTVRAYLDALDAAYALEGMTSPPRPVNDFDYPIDGVKSRFVIHERVPYLYLVNLRDEAVRVKLTGPYSAGIDLVTGNRIEFPGPIDPLAPMIIQLDAPAPSDVMARADKLENTDTVRLAPVVDEAEMKKPAPRPAERRGRGY